MSIFMKKFIQTPFRNSCFVVIIEKGKVRLRFIICLDEIFIEKCRVSAVEYDHFVSLATWILAGILN